MYIHAKCVGGLVRLNIRLLASLKISTETWLKMYSALAD